MNTNKKEMSLEEKIQKGLDIAYRRMLEFKIMHKTKVVEMRDDKIVFLDPAECLEDLNRKMQEGC